MKANVAPEKIYISNYSSGFTYNWHLERLAVKDIEYIRTDAFIEKACAWFRTLDDKEPPYETTEEFIDAFIKAMKL